MFQTEVTGPCSLTDAAASDGQPYASVSQAGPAALRLSPDAQPASSAVQQLSSSVAQHPEQQSHPFGCSEQHQQQQRQGECGRGDAGFVRQQQTEGQGECGREDAGFVRQQQTEGQGECGREDAGFVLFGCRQCSAVFNSAFSLKLHKRVHKARTAVCLRCGDVFSGSADLARHRQVCVGFLPQQPSSSTPGAATTTTTTTTAAVGRAGAGGDRLSLIHISEPTRHA